MPTLNWIGKEDVEKHIKEIPTHLLRCDRELSHGDPAFDLSPGTGNLIVEGDNLLALKALLPYYKNQVKCIYIDPPYNTGNEGWSYNDNVNSPQIRAWLGKAVDAEDLCRHDKWLCMMRPRLEYHHQLLRDDGAIFISIDDNELHHLRALCDEIFGASNFVANIIWQKMDSPKNTAKHLSEDHDYVLIYAKNASTWRPKNLERSPEMIARYKNPDHDPRGLWLLSDLAARNFYSQGRYPLTTPSGKIIEGPPAGSYWRVSREKFDELDRDNRIWWGKNKDSRPGMKRFLSEVQEGVTPQTLWFWKDVGSTRNAKQELSAIMDAGASQDLFITPKPTGLIERILQIATNPGDIVLDSFAGSGTTGHAVLKMNAQNPDALPRRFVLVELEEKIARPITRERVKRVIDGYGKHEHLEGGFRFCHLGEPILDPEGGLNPNAAWRDLAHFFYLERFGTALESSKLNIENGFIGKAGGVSLFLRRNALNAPLLAAGMKERSSEAAERGCRA